MDVDAAVVDVVTTSVVELDVLVDSSMVIAGPSIFDVPVGALTPSSPLHPIMSDAPSTPILSTTESSLNFDNSAPHLSGSVSRTDSVISIRSTGSHSWETLEVR